MKIADEEGIFFSWTDALASKNMAVLITGSKGENRGALRFYRKREIN